MFEGIQLSSEVTEEVRNKVIASKKVTFIFINRGLFGIKVVNVPE